MEESFNNLGVWLKNRLEERKMSVEELANSSGLSRAVIYFYMKDKARPKEQAIISMCQALGTDVAEGMSQYTPNRIGRPPK